jgi:hypothetical protein
VSTRLHVALCSSMPEESSLGSVVMLRGPFTLLALADSTGRQLFFPALTKVVVPSGLAARMSYD